MGPRCLNEILFIVFAVSDGGVGRGCVTGPPTGTYVVLYHLTAAQ